MPPIDPTTHGLSNALLLAEREDLAAVDRRALREAGVRTITIVSSGCEAARLLARPEGSLVQVVLCNSQLADMSGDEFVHLVRLHPRLLVLPVLAVVTELTRQTEAMIRAARYSGLLVRPYTQQQLREQLGRAASWQRQLREAMGGASPGSDSSRFEEALQQYETVRKVEDPNAGQQYRQGLLAVRQHNWDEGISLLQQVVRDNPHHGEAVVALATAWRGKGNEGKSRGILREAVAVFVENENWDKAFAVADRLMGDDPGMSNPLLEESGRLVVAGKYSEAVEAAVLARRLSPANAVLEGLGRACIASSDSAQAVRGLLRALAEHGESEWGREFESRFSQKLEALERDAAAAVASASASTGKSAKKCKDRSSPERRAKGGRGGPHVLKEPGASFLDAFPTLRDAWNVAKITASLFRMLK